MHKRLNKMEKSKNPEKHNVEGDKPSKKSGSLLTKEEDNAKIITCINLRPDFRFNKFPNRKNITKYFSLKECIYCCKKIF